MPRQITIIRVGALGSLSLRAWIFAGVLLCLSAASHAAGLGQLNVLSALGEPFRAEIDVIAKKSELGSLSVKMGTPAAFQNAGLSYTGDIAAMRVTLDRRDSGEPFVVITSTESLNEPFIDLLVELSWAAGRITRQFTALLDPPFVVAERERQAAERARREAELRAAPTQPAPQPEPLPEAVAEAPVSEPVPAPEPPATDLISEPETPETVAATPEASGPVETIGGTAPTLFSAEPSLPSAPTADSYGPVKRGDTLYKIARENKRAELTIEQMLVLLFRNNPEAFIGQNMNRMRTGKILRLPDESDFGAVSPADARREVRVQAADWNAYRDRLAAAAAQETPSAQPAEQVAKGQITPRVEDKAPDAQQPKEVVKLSKGEPVSGGAPGTGETAGTRAMEEELVAREKALEDANTRIARLEKTIKDLQALVEVKSQGMADLQQQAGQPSAPAQPPQPEPKPSAPAPTPEDKAPAPAAEQTPPARTESAPPAPARETAPAPAAPAQQARPRPAPPPPPAPPPSLLDRVLEQPLYLAGLALGVLVVGLLALRVVKRRREAKGEVAEEVAPAASAGGAAAFAPTETDVGLSSERSRDIAEEVDPLEEAEIFLAYGRDAQAEELLKEALTVHPNRHEIHLKLLEIYAKRKDARAFEGAANQLEKATGGKGDLWDRVVALGYQVSPDNPRYAAGRTESDEVPAETASEAERLDLDIGLGGDAESTTATDINLGDGGEFERTQIMSVPPVEEDSEPAFERTTQSPAMDFEAEVPAAEPSESASDADESGAKNANAIDFDFDVSKLSAGEPEAGTEPEQEAKSDNGLDFDIGTLSLDTGPGEEESQSTDTMPSIDLSNISLDMDSATTSPTSPVGKDEKWYEVQTKFDLAKAYQEMGDKDGAREILREVIAEGDAEQKAAAQEVLSSLE